MTFGVKEEGLDFCLTGVRPDANYFNYAAEHRSSRQVVMDFTGGHMTAGIAPGSFCRAMASSLTMGCEEADQFGAFLDSTTFDEISGQLEAAYLFYQLLKGDEFSFSEASLQAVLRFGSQYCLEEDNAEAGGKLLSLSQENGWALTPDVFVEFWRFICKYTEYMIYTLYDLLQETLYQCAGEADAPCAALDAMLGELRAASPRHYSEYLDYLNSDNCVEQLLLYLKDHTNLYTNLFYIRWLMRSYPLAEGLRTREPVEKLLKTLLENLRRIPGSEKSMIRILLDASSNHALFEAVLQVFLSAIREQPQRLEGLCSAYAEASANLTDEKAGRFERFLLETPSAGPLAITLCAKKIAAAKDPEEDFWRFYEQQRSLISRMEDFTLEPMVLACLGRLEGQAKERTALRMVQDLDRRLLPDGAGADALIEAIDGASIKTLMKTDPSVLSRVCWLRSEPGRSGMEKVRAVLTGEAVERQGGGKAKSLSSLLGGGETLVFSLADLDRADYEAYSKRYFSAFLAQVQGSGDIALLMKLFYHRQCFINFVDDYVVFLRKMEKKDGERRRLLVAWTCVYLAAAERNDAAAEELYRPVIRCLRNFDEADLSDIQKRAGAEAPGPRCERIFEEVRRKEGFQEKLGGLFRRK